MRHCNYILTAWEETGNGLTTRCSKRPEALAYLEADPNLEMLAAWTPRISWDPVVYSPFWAHKVDFRSGSKLKGIQRVDRRHSGAPHMGL